MSKLLDNLLSARLSGVPLLAVATQDQPGTVETINDAINDCPKVMWDCVNGLRPLNDAGKQSIIDCGQDPKDSFRMVTALKAALRFTPKTLFYLCNGHRMLDDPQVVQALHNLREAYLDPKRTLVLLGPSFSEMRQELQSDVIVLEESLPTDDQVAKRIEELHDPDAGFVLDKTRLPKMIDAVRGLRSMFTVEQVVSLSFRQKKIDLGVLWDHKKAAIDAQKGTSIKRGTMRYSDLAGMDTVMKFIKGIANGPRRFRVILFWDEIEKMIGQKGDDGNNIAADYLGVCLKIMERLRWMGFILFGVPGSGKTALCEATSGEFEVPIIEQDFGGMKGKFVGESEGAVRESFRTVEGIGGNDVLVMATCNKLNTLPPEFRRRFWLGNWYFDVPTPREQEPIKTIYEKKLGINAKKHGQWPDTTGWTGAEIRNCAELTQLLTCSLVEASRYVVPIAQADPESIENLRDVADGRFLNVSAPGMWKRSDNTVEVVATRSRRTIG